MISAQFHSCTAQFTFQCFFPTSVCFVIILQGISNQWKESFPVFPIPAVLQTDFSSPCVPKVTPALIVLVLAGDSDSTPLPLTHLPLFHSYKINRIFRKEWTAWERSTTSEKTGKKEEELNGRWIFPEAPTQDQFCATLQEEKQAASHRAWNSKKENVIQDWTRLVVHTFLGSISIYAPVSTSTLLCNAPGACGRPSLQRSAGAAGMKGAGASETWLPALARAWAWQGPSCPSGGGFSYTKGLWVQTQEGDDLRSLSWLEMACGCETVTSIQPSSKMRKAGYCLLS